MEHRRNNSQCGATMIEMLLLLALLLVVGIPSLQTLGPRAADPLCMASSGLEHGARSLNYTYWHYDRESGCQDEVTSCIIPGMCTAD